MQTGEDAHTHTHAQMNLLFSCSMGYAALTIFFCFSDSFLNIP